MNRFSITLGEDLYNVIHDRSKANHRSMGKEILALIEAGLAADFSAKESILRQLLFEAQEPQPGYTEPHGSQISTSA